MRVHEWTIHEFDAAVAAGVFGRSLGLELIEGQLVEIAMTQTPRHAAVVQLLTRVFTAPAPIPDRWPSAMVRVRSPLTCGRLNELVPDFAVVPGSHVDYVKEHPSAALLVVEVSDAQSLAMDREKAAIYAAASAMAYWIVDLVNDAVVVLTNPSTSERRYRREETFVPSGLGPTHAYEHLYGLSLADILGLQA